MQSPSRASPCTPSSPQYSTARIGGGRRCVMFGDALDEMVAQSPTLHAPVVGREAIVLRALELQSPCFVEQDASQHVREFGSIVDDESEYDVPTFLRKQAD